jgi:hypothetical protein
VLDRVKSSGVRQSEMIPDEPYLIIIVPCLMPDNLCPEKCIGHNFAAKI